MAFAYPQASLDASLVAVEMVGDSYVLGPLDEFAVVEVSFPRAFERERVVLMPTSLHAVFRVLEESVFQEGLEAGLRNDDDFGETPVEVVDWVFQEFSDELRRGGTQEWIAGFLVGSLSRLAQENRLLALVGLSHVCFLLAVVPYRISPVFQRAMSLVEVFHRQALQRYREHVGTLKMSGVALVDAWALAFDA